MNSPIAFNADPIVTLAGVDVVYRLPIERITSLKEYALRWARGQNRFVDVWALRDVSFCIGPAEAVGIVGSNGAGKSTLLKVIARVLRPGTGRVRVRGAVAPVLELGAGFDMELTGRENIYLHGAMLGYSRAAMDVKMDALLEFAGVGSLVDAPLRTYSSGMVARLGFAIATDVAPDLLLVDEVLAVGDLGFQEKCLRRMERFVHDGTTLIVVSHNPATLAEICNRIIWLDHGRVRAIGSPQEILPRYGEFARCNYEGIFE